MKFVQRTDYRNLGVVTVVLGLAPFLVLGSSYYTGIFSHVLTLALFAIAINIVFGHTDQLFLFTGGLAGIGAYTTALLADGLGVSAWLVLPVAALLCGLIGMSVSWISARRRLTIVLIAILTLNLQLVFSQVFIGAREITGGSTGFRYSYFSITEIARAVGAPEKVVVYYLLLALLVAALGFYLRLIRSKYGLAFEIIRQDEVSAEATGVNVVRYKTIAGFIAAVMIGMTGPFMAREAAFILPSAFSFLAVDVVVLIVLIIGGLRTMYGPIVGAVLVVGIEQYLASNAASWRTAIFGLLLIVLFISFERGVITTVRDKIGVYQID